MCEKVSKKWVRGKEEKKKTSEQVEVMRKLQLVLLLCAAASFRNSVQWFVAVKYMKLRIKILFSFFIVNVLRANI